MKTPAHLGISEDWPGDMEFTEVLGEWLNLRIRVLEPGFMHASEMNLIRARFGELGKELDERCPHRDKWAGMRISGE